VHSAASSGLGLDGKSGRAKAATVGLHQQQLRHSTAAHGGDDESGEDEGGRGAAAGRKNRRRGDEDEGEGGSGGSGGEEDPFYAAVAAAAARKKARKAAAAEDARLADQRFLQQAGEHEEAGVGPNAHRRASKAILQNRGLVKYRNREMSNPRVANRIKAERFAKRRSGQAAPMRNKGGSEAGVYGGEASGIRTTISRSRKIA
jgi:hypothetical protein